MKFKRSVGFYDFGSNGGSTAGAAFLPRIIIAAFLFLAATQTLTFQLRQPTWTKNINVSIPTNMPKFLSGQREPTNYQGIYVSRYFYISYFLALSLDFYYLHH